MKQEVEKNTPLYKVYEIIAPIRSLRFKILPTSPTVQMKCFIFQKMKT